MKFVDLAVGTILYTGSARIFAIRCYLEQHRWVWEPYLRRNRYIRSLKGIDDATWDRIAMIVTNYNRQMDAISEDDKPWGSQVAVVAILEQLTFRFLYNVSIATVLQEHFRRTKWTPGSLELVRYAEGIENHTMPLDAEFYSVMRQPIQFFGTLSTASGYSKYVYKYVVEEPLRLVDISDRATSQELLDTVFASWKPFTDEDVKYYSGLKDDIGDVRDDVLYFLVNRFPTSRDTLLQLLYKYYGKKISVPLSWSASKIATTWNTCFTHEIVSPRGLWIASQLGILEGVSNRRYDMYVSDALIVKIFTTGTGLDGWYNEKPQEWMIYHPERYGMLVPHLEYPFQGSECEFSLPSPRVEQEVEAPESPDPEVPPLHDDDSGDESDGETPKRMAF